jgi:tripartite-type tricarboxylate transporter receptor subunit TctC
MTTSPFPCGVLRVEANGSRGADETRRIATAVIALVLFGHSLVHAQWYPAKPIRLIVPFPPGGGTDLVARALAQKLGENAGIKVVVDNRPGGNTAIVRSSRRDRRRAIVERLNAEFVKVIAAPDFKAWLMNQGAEAVTSTPEEFAAFVKAEIAQYAILVKKSGFRPD